MHCCTECFNSPYIKGVINNSDQFGDCHFCETKNVKIYLPQELSLIFQPVLDLYRPVRKNGMKILDHLEANFKNKIFSEKSFTNRGQLLQSIISNDAEQYKKLFRDKVEFDFLFNPDAVSKVNPLQTSWGNFAEEIKKTNRFHIQNVIDLPTLKTLLERYSKGISRGRIYHRARIAENPDGFPKEQMGNPPADKAKAGRANPSGISYLYLADSVETTLYEARASYLDYVCVGAFRLKKDIQVVTLRGNSYDPFVLGGQEVLEDFLIHRPFINRLESELSKPRRRSDNELDYLPTQYLCEFIKSIGFQGVEYQSSLYDKGYNLAIFDSQYLEPISTKTYEIKEMSLKHEEIAYDVVA